MSRVPDLSRAVGVAILFLLGSSTLPLNAAGLRVTVSDGSSRFVGTWGSAWLQRTTAEKPGDPQPGGCSTDCVFAWNGARDVLPADSKLRYWDLEAAGDGTWFIKEADGSGRLGWKSEGDARDCGDVWEGHLCRRVVLVEADQNARWRLVGDDAQPGSYKIRPAGMADLQLYWSWLPFVDCPGTGLDSRNSCRAVVLAPVDLPKRGLHEGSWVISPVDCRNRLYPSIEAQLEACDTSARRSLWINYDGTKNLQVQTFTGPTTVRSMELLYQQMGLPTKPGLRENFLREIYFRVAEFLAPFNIAVRRMTCTDPATQTSISCEDRVRVGPRDVTIFVGGYVSGGTGDDGHASGFMSNGIGSVDVPMTVDHATIDSWQTSERAYEVAGVIAHELGHDLGLVHPTSQQAGNRDLMFGFGGTGKGMRFGEMRFSDERNPVAERIYGGERSSVQQSHLHVQVALGEREPDPLRNVVLVNSVHPDWTDSMAEQELFDPFGGKCSFSERHKFEYVGDWDVIEIVCSRDGPVELEGHLSETAGPAGWRMTMLAFDAGGRRRMATGSLGRRSLINLNCTEGQNQLLAIAATGPTIGPYRLRPTREVSACADQESPND